MVLSVIAGGKILLVRNVFFKSFHRDLLPFIELCWLLSWYVVAFENTRVGNENRTNSYECQYLFGIRFRSVSAYTACYTYLTFPEGFPPLHHKISLHSRKMKTTMASVAALIASTSGVAAFTSRPLARFAARVSLGLLRVWKYILFNIYNIPVMSMLLIFLWLACFQFIIILGCHRQTNVYWPHAPRWW